MKKAGNYGKLFRSMAKEWKWMFGYIGRYKYILVLYIILGLLASAMSLGTSVASKYLIDAVVQHSGSELPKYISLAVGLAVFQYVFQALSSWMTSVVSSKVNNEIRQEIYTHIISAEWEDIGAFHSGDLLNRLEGDASTVSAGVIGFIPSAFTRAAQFFGAFAVVFYYDKTMAFLALMSAPFLFFSSRFLLKNIRKFNRKSRELNGKILSYSEESMQNLQTVKAFDLTKQYSENFRALLEEYRSTRLAYDKFSILTTLCLSLLGMVVSYSCYGWGIYRLWQGAISFGTMTMFLQISGMLTSSFSALASLAPTAVSTATAAGRIMEVTCFNEEKDGDSEKALEILEESRETGVELIFDGVSFAYRDSDDPVLNEVSIFAKPGETIALVGPSGEGKTTVLKLILGIVKPSGGRIYLKSESGKTIDISDSTRRFCSYVPQEVNAFSGTVAENLRMVCPEADDEQLIEALKAADLADFVLSLPDGLNSVVEENGANFSCGQLQRLAIARALLKNSLILIMDETTSALDIDTEGRVLKNIMIADPARICIITTHRKSMLKYCDRVYEINSEGNVEEKQQRNGQSES